MTLSQVTRILDIKTRYTIAKETSPSRTLKRALLMRQALSMLVPDQGRPCLLQCGRQDTLPARFQFRGPFVSKIVDRTLDFLELFAKERRPLSLSDIAHLLSIPISSCHDVVQALQSRGYLYEIAPRAGYYPTMRLQALAKEIGDNDPVLMRCELLLDRCAIPWTNPFCCQRSAGWMQDICWYLNRHIRYAFLSKSATAYAVFTEHLRARRCWAV